MLVNKWIHFALSVAGGLAALGATLDWSTVLSPQASAAVATGIFVIKGILNTVAPAPGKVAKPTQGAIVTHN